MASTNDGLSAAARDGNLARIKAIAAHCDVDARDALGWCAVHRACVHGQAASLRCLVKDCGAAVDVADDDGWRCLHRAAWVGDPQTLKVLVRELGAAVESTCEGSGEAAVHVAARNGRLKALRCLATELGANVAARDAFGRTAAHFAAWEGHVHILRSLKLLGHLADDANEDALLIAADRDGRLPVDYADDRGARDASTWLRSRACVQTALAAREARPPGLSTPVSRASTPGSRAAASTRTATPQRPSPAGSMAAATASTPMSARTATPRRPPLPPALDPAERARAALMASQLVAELQLTDRRADALAAYLVAARGFASFAELLDPELLDELDSLGPYGLLEIPKRKLARRREWWSHGEEALSPDIGPAMAALGLT